MKKNLTPHILKIEVLKAFTLIEVIISISILSIIFMTAYRGLSQIARSKTLLDDEREILQIANTLTSRLSRELQMTIKDGEIQYPGEKELIFKGMESTVAGSNRGDQVIFLANEAGQYVPDGATHSGLVTISYRVAKDPDAVKTDSANQTYLLVREEIPNIQPVEEALEKIITFPITNRLKSLEFNYFNPKSKNWQSTWEERDLIPSMVSFKFKLLTPLGREFIFATAVPITAGIENDPQTGLRP